MAVFVTAHQQIKIILGYGLAVCLMLLSGCQQIGPREQIQQDADAKFSQYQSYAFMRGSREATPDSEIAGYFTSAIREQMDAHGYRYSGDKPDLLINYRLNIQNKLKEEGNAVPTTIDEAGFYSHSDELYEEIPASEETTRRFIERKGSAQIDIIDASTMKTIWQGQTEGNVTEATLIEPEQPIRRMVKDLFRKFPHKK